MAAVAPTIDGTQAATGYLLPPGAYIVGAPKCGTTALAHYLSQHPHIAFSRPKEPHHFATDLPGLRRSTDDRAYRALFDAGADTRLAMEASVWYLYSATAIPGILAVRPDARFVVMLRHPVRMLASLHRQLLNAFDEDELDFETAWRLSHARARGENIPRTCRAPATLVYTRTAAFGDMVARLLASVDRDRVLVLFQEELQADTGLVYRRTLDFLGLDDDGRRSFPRINEATGYRSRQIRYLVARGRPIREFVSKPLKRLLGLDSLGVMKRMQTANTAPARATAIAPALQDEIAHHYEDDIRHLGKLLDRDLPALYGWPAPGPQATPARPAGPTS